VTQDQVRQARLVALLRRLDMPLDTIGRVVELDGPAAARAVRAWWSDAFFDDAFSRLRALAPGLQGIAGVPFLIFYGEVSEDSDGPIELCRGVDADPAALTEGTPADVQVRREAAHDEAYVRLSMQDAVWPAMLPAYDALEPGQESTAASQPAFPASS
jgi:hypothetical protein